MKPTALSITVFAAWIILGHYSAGAAMIALSLLFFATGINGIAKRQISVRFGKTGPYKTYVGGTAIFWGLVFVFLGFVTAAYGAHTLHPTLFQI